MKGLLRITMLTLWGLVGYQQAIAAEAKTASGEYLAQVAGCTSCHTAPGGEPFAGGREISSPFGSFVSPNITPSKANGIGEWTLAEFSSAITGGKTPNGNLLYPACPTPSYAGLEKPDLKALYQYFMSVTPVENASPDHDLRQPYAQRGLLSLRQRLTANPKPQQVSRGEYLVNTLGHCNECHSSRDWLGAKVPAADNQGAMIKGWFAPPLNGLASVVHWTQAETVEWLTTGKNQHATALGPMGAVIKNSLQHLSAEDAIAMAEYLRRLPAKQQTLEQHFLSVAKDLKQAQITKGEPLYKENCSGCHGAAGEGTDAALALNQNRTVTSPHIVNLIQSVMNGGFGPSTKGNPQPYGMPPFSGRLSHEDIAAIMTYTRNAWNNDTSPIHPKDIERYYQP